MHTALQALEPRRERRFADLTADQIAFQGCHFSQPPAMSFPVAEFGRQERIHQVAATAARRNGVVSDDAKIPEAVQMLMTRQDLVRIAWSPRGR